METTAVKNREDKTGVTFNAYYRVHPDDRQKFIDAVADHIPYTAAQPGCVFYVFAADILDPNTFHLSEGWEDEEAITIHHDSAPFREALNEVMTSVRILDHQGQRYEIAAHADGSPPGGVTVTA
ncbi:putative quinol monooxygenase [Microbacterium sp. SA39]|uniref:putative quinol monooxygenase n=1 Tax=Microbacterium sp. SA39 TaxID=1263625 RepID=UPI0005FA0194|nr:antibiotic biosynthesis monooxygenase family protein [Microbacterium sp. SA39]KJQ52706.1 putative monooxygenase YcnE [Microbacterium sp. SA39]